MKLLARLLCSLALVIGTAAHAQTFVLSTSLDAGLPTGSVGTISFTQDGSDTRVDLLADWNSDLFGNGVFLRQLFLSYAGTSPLQLASSAGDAAVKGLVALPDNKGQQYDYAVQFANAFKDNRLQDGESISLWFANTDADAFDVLSMVHLQGLNGGASVKVVTTPIPEPEAWAMLALGVGGMSLLRRRRRLAR